MPAADGESVSVVIDDGGATPERSDGKSKITSAKGKEKEKGKGKGRTLVLMPESGDDGDGGGMAAAADNDGDSVQATVGGRSFSSSFSFSAPDAGKQKGSNALSGAAGAEAEAEAEAEAPTTSSPVEINAAADGKGDGGKRDLVPLVEKEGAEPYTTNEMVDQLNRLFNRAGRVLSMDYYEASMRERSLLRRRRIRGELSEAAAAGAGGDGDGAGDEGRSTTDGAKEMTAKTSSAGGMKDAKEDVAPVKPSTTAPAPAANNVLVPALSVSAAGAAAAGAVKATQKILAKRADAAAATTAIDDAILPAAPSTSCKAPRASGGKRRLPESDGDEEQQAQGDEGEDGVTPTAATAATSDVNICTTTAAAATRVSNGDDHTRRNSRSHSTPPQPRGSVGAGGGGGEASPPAAKRPRSVEPASGSGGGGAGKRKNGTVSGKASSPAAVQPEEPAKVGDGGGDDGGGYLGDVGVGGDSDDEMPVPMARLSLKRDSSRSSLERARTKAVLGKGRAGSKLRGKAPLAGGSGGAGSIPRKGAAGVGSTAGGGGGMTIPKKSRYVFFALILLRSVLYVQRSLYQTAGGSSWRGNNLEGDGGMYRWASVGTCSTRGHAHARRYLLYVRTIVAALLWFRTLIG